MISFWKYLKFYSSFHNRLRLFPVFIWSQLSQQSSAVCSAVRQVIGSLLNLAIESDYLALGNELVLLYSSWHSRS